MTAAVDLRVRFPVDDAELSGLHDRAFGSPQESSAPWAAQLERHSLTWIGAFDGAALVGFVQVCWDGATHAFVLDTVVDPTRRRAGIGRRLVEAAVVEAERAGCTWVHVDFEEDLSTFYLGACGFRPTPAGLRRLRG